MGGESRVPAAGALPPALRYAAMLALLLACAAPDPAVQGRLASALAFPAAAGPLRAEEGPAQPLPGGAVGAVAWDVVPGFRAAGALYLPSGPTDAAVLVAPGHYGENKTAAESQEIAQRLAAGGVAALAVDTPGTEEWETPGRLLHFTEGAHHRAFLAAAGTSALALQVAVLRRGLDLLEARGFRRFAATGASGGAVLSFYLAILDHRIGGAALASMPDVPREARAGGCPCDQIPGWPGPDPALLALPRVPLLWMADQERPRPEGLPRRAAFEVHAGPHTYTRTMQDRALAWLRDRLDLPIDLDAAAIEPERVEVHTAGVAAAPDAPGLYDLPVASSATWTPAPVPGLGAGLDCEGTGPTILVVGRNPAAVSALGFRACLATPLDEGETALAEALATGQAYADRVGGSVCTAARNAGAAALWAARAWSVAVAGCGLPWVLEDPLERPSDLAPADPPWVHVPGAWWGSLTAVHAGALARGDDAQGLARALHAALSPAAPAHGAARGSAAPAARTGPSPRP